MFYKYEENSDPVKILVIQPNIDPYNDKFGNLTHQTQLNIILNEAEKANSKDIDYFVGPETAILGKNRESKMLESSPVINIKNYIDKNSGAKFVIGAETQREYRSGELLSHTARLNDLTKVWEDRYNSAIQIDSSGEVQIYHKSKLVIGVEKMPFSRYLKFLEKFPVKLGGTFGSLGDQNFRETFVAANSTSVAPIICFESIYGQYVTDYVKAGATILFVITNDGWWKNSNGTWQHLNLSRLRAIETRRSVARSANTGISAFINQQGELINTLGVGKEGSIAASINNNTILTMYVQYGDSLGIIALVMSLSCLSSILVLKLRKRVPKRS
jgi:apolipoprotein N-acyltransferase